MGNLSEDFDAQGILNDTPLYDLPEPFDIVYSIPTESFHLLQVGIAKQIISRLFEDTSTAESRRIMLAWSTTYQTCAVFTETPRCSRKINTGRMNGSEMGVMVYSAFPSLVQLMKDRILDHW